MCPYHFLFIGNLSIEKALLDLGTNVNILPSSVYKLFRFKELKPILVTLQLANRSIKESHGMIENVLVKVDEFYFPVDFLVLDIEQLWSDPKHILIILG